MVTRYTRAGVGKSRPVGSRSGPLFICGIIEPPYSGKLTLLALLAGESFKLVEKQVDKITPCDSKSLIRKCRGVVVVPVAQDEPAWHPAVQYCMTF